MFSPLSLACGPQTRSRRGQVFPMKLSLPLLWLALLAPAGAAPPNILLIVTDDQRPDTIHALGNATIDTPNLDGLVQRGVAFTRAIAANPHCTPSRAEIMTGATGFRNGSPPF